MLGVYDTRSRVLGAQYFPKLTHQLAGFFEIRCQMVPRDRRTGWIRIYVTEGQDKLALQKKENTHVICSIKLRCHTTRWAPVNGVQARCQVRSIILPPESWVQAWYCRLRAVEINTQIKQVRGGGGSAWLPVNHEVQCMFWWWWVNECLTIGITLTLLTLNSNHFTPPIPHCSSQSPISGMASLSTQVLHSKIVTLFLSSFPLPAVLFAKSGNSANHPRGPLSYSPPWLLVCFLLSLSTMLSGIVVRLPINVCVPTYTLRSLRAGPMFILFIRLYSIISTCLAYHRGSIGIQQMNRHVLF